MSFTPNGAPVSIEEARRLVELHEKLEREKECLPHKHSKLYKWQRRFLDCENKKNFLCAANQIGSNH